ncbi:TPA: bifunctional (p)ppGpp synthetase/guanosine-3',5'-bis(diphosphate) 3'-pyrophosphohydrolase, partial [Streptococcus pneumoniae]|nr:bifunctional (p)ppGpp synthetase/guanosine-3',5'-bis(diphosphate) 3'-pyrophosphohydrolase [Streptococcus pneumoniae]
FREAAEDESLRKVLLVTFSDKLANLMELYQDYLIIGGLLWDRFNSKDPKKQRWYFNEFYKIFKDNQDLFSKNKDILNNYKEILKLLFYNN